MDGPLRFRFYGASPATTVILYLLYSTFQAQNMDRRIHILGVGNIGKYIAYALAGLSQTRTTPSVRLLFHRKSLVTEWEKAGCAIEYTPLDQDCCTSVKPGQTSYAHDVQIELLYDRESQEAEAAEGPIRNLIVTTKAHNTITALAPLRHRLDKNSHILFLQNGMGVTDEVTSALFRDPNSRPTYWTGICSAGVYSRGPFSIVHAGPGPLRFGADNDIAGSVAGGPLGSRKMHGGRRITVLEDALLKAHMLRPQRLSPGEILQAQLTKLVINSVINPLTALRGCKNGAVFADEEGDRDRRILVQEAGAIVRELLQQSTKTSPGATLSDSELLTAVAGVAEATADNTSSMLQDIRAGRPTEIDYINGYLVRKAELLNLPCQRHKELVAEIKEKEKEMAKENEEPKEDRDGGAGGNLPATL
ncbi:hypothetical protein VTJ83DRAFT_4133 [Remersonia thermophila]|uniref:2-dehydropantoate 2-reductase n=1 Tax=Remersonia thermophila TaxID=72144 RepID=A0ABR4DAK6_9PEZI